METVPSMKQQKYGGIASMQSKHNRNEIKHQLCDGRATLESNYDLRSSLVH